jgi:hypothetical protein
MLIMKSGWLYMANTKPSSPSSTAYPKSLSAGFMVLGDLGHGGPHNRRFFDWQIDQSGQHT